MPTFTLVHVVISVIALLSGFVVVCGFVTARRLDNWTAVFLATTIATSATGFGFSVDRLLPSHVVGLISLVLLAVASYARYSRRMAGLWRPTFVVAAVVALYLNVFVLIVQSFLRVPALTAMAPTQSEPPFVIAQVTALLVFLVLGVLSVRGFRLEKN
jgi:hypothetical protein